MSGYYLQFSEGGIFEWVKKEFGLLEAEALGAMSGLENFWAKAVGTPPANLPDGVVVHTELPGTVAAAPVAPAPVEAVVPSSAPEAAPQG